jgi:hypothetical protein
MKVIAYWEKVDVDASVPWHILLCLASMRLVFSDNFLLLTPKNVDQYIGEEYKNKYWSFGTKEESESQQKKVSIVAKSDYIRMKYIYEHGGFWFDSDALCVGDPKNLLDMLNNYQIVWGYEAFFGSRKGNAAFKTASNNMLEMPCQIWGNPGLIKSLVEGSNDSSIAYIPNNFLNPRTNSSYSWQDTSILFSEKISPHEFLSDDQVFLHLFNKFTEKKVKENKLSNNFSIYNLFQSDILLSKIIKMRYSEDSLRKAVDHVLLSF